jgi:hypothetical protein
VLIVGGEVMILGKVVKELLDVATPMVDCIVRDKAVRFH